MKWFGRKWNSRCCASADKVPTPVLQPCLSCTKLILRGDQGFMVPDMKTVTIEEGRPPTAVIVLAPWHLDCFLKNVLPKSMLQAALEAAEIVGPGPSKGSS